MKIYIFKNGKLCPFCGLKKNRQVSTSFPICFSEKIVSKRASKNKNYVLQQLYSQLKVFALHLHRTGNHLLKVFLYFNLSVFPIRFVFFFSTFSWPNRKRVWHLKSMQENAAAKGRRCGENSRGKEE